MTPTHVNFATTIRLAQFRWVTTGIRYDFKQGDDDVAAVRHAGVPSHGCRHITEAAQGIGDRPAVVQFPVDGQTLRTSMTIESFCG